MKRGLLYSGPSCLDRCCNCLAGVPIPSLAAWMLLVFSVSACIGGLLVGEHRTRALLKDDEIDLLSGRSVFLIPYQQEICIGVLCGMVVFGCLHLLVASISSNRLRPRCFNTRRKNICGRVLNVVVGCFGTLLHFAWQLLSTIIAIPLLLFGILYFLHKKEGATCIDLKDYAISRKTKEVCGADLDAFYKQSLEVIQCYGVSYVASLLVVTSLKLVGICTGANYVHLQESRFETFYAYDEETRAQEEKDKDKLNGTEIPLVEGEA